MELHSSYSNRFRSIAQAACIVAFLITLGSCKDRGAVSHSPQPTASAGATASPQEPRQTMPTMTPYPPNTTYRRKEGRVPDAATAIKIAEAVWFPVYGAHIESEKPFTATLVNGVWIVQGTLPKDVVGGTAYAEISKETGCILNVTHFK